jgi:hypothetical protein
MLKLQVASLELKVLALHVEEIKRHQRHLPISELSINIDWA